MFLELTKRRNPKLLEAAKILHQKGAILPDTYVLDLDTIVSNAASMRKKAGENGIELFYMTKQFGRNPLVAEKIREAGIEDAVVVDYKEALVLMERGLPIGNIGHLVQVPFAVMEKIVAYGPKYITVYSLEKLNQINALAGRLKKNQKVLIKLIEKGDEVYEGQFGGFHLENIHELAEFSKTLEHIEISGVTSFPCFLFDGKENLQPTHNVQTARKAFEIFESHGIFCHEMNMPSATCSRTIPMIRELGGTQGEPGHALTGTTPLHAKLDLEELPAMVYVSEISHNLDGKGYFYGGGYYRRGNMEHILVSKEGKESSDKVLAFGNDSIDYYLACAREHEVGATVLAAFRTQIFVTRSDVAVVSGIQSGAIRIEGIYDSLGKRLER